MDTAGFFAADDGHHHHLMPQEQQPVHSSSSLSSKRSLSVDSGGSWSTFFPLDDAVNYDGHERPLFVVQVTELADGVFVGFVYNHALSDGTAFWDFISAWAEAARARLGAPRAQLARAAPLFERWSADGGAAAPVVLVETDQADQPLTHKLSALMQGSTPC